MRKRFVPIYSRDSTDSFNPKQLSQHFNFFIVVIDSSLSSSIALERWPCRYYPSIMITFISDSLLACIDVFRSRELSPWTLPAIMPRQYKTISLPLSLSLCLWYQENYSTALFLIVNVLRIRSRYFDPTPHIHFLSVQYIPLRTDNSLTI